MVVTARVQLRKRSYTSVGSNFEHTVLHMRPLATTSGQQLHLPVSGVPQGASSVGGSLGGIGSRGTKELLRWTVRAICPGERVSMALSALKKACGASQLSGPDKVQCVMRGFDVRSFVAGAW
jgi:hypothetical protein